MATKENAVKRYVIKGPKAKAQSVCKLGIRKIPVEQLAAELEQLLAMTKKDGTKFTHVRGTLVCY